MSSQVIAALIGGGAGLITGAVGSLVAPWVNWGIEQRRLRRERRAELVQEWRTGIADFRELEFEVSPVLPFPGVGGGRILVTTNQSDPLRADIHRMSWFISLRPHLSKKGRPDADRLGHQRVSERGHGKLPDLLSREVNQLEASWKLV